MGCLSVSLLCSAWSVDYLVSQGLPSRIGCAPRLMLVTLAEVAVGAWRIVYRLASRLGPRGARLLYRTGLTNVTQSTLAITRLEAGSASNVVPRTASAVLDIRLQPGDGTAETLNRVEGAVKDRFGVNVEVLERIEPSRVSPAAGPLFDALTDAIRLIAPDAVVVPCLSPNDSDSKFFADIAEVQYRFVPVRITPAELASIHGTDERITVTAYHDVVRAYRAIIQAIDATNDSSSKPAMSTEATL